MRILVISDTHSQLDRFWNVFNKLMKENPVQMIVHCGDHYSDAQDIRMRAGLPVFAVKGNCDGSYSDDDCLILETEAGDFFVAHGHMQNVGFSLQNLYYTALDKGCIGALFGHTHRANYVSMGDCYMMNPGSLTNPRDGSGGTFGILETSELNVWGKIYSYDDFMKTGSKPSGNKPKVTGGKLRSMLNYSDRF